MENSGPSVSLPRKILRPPLRSRLSTARFQPKLGSEFS